MRTHFDRRDFARLSLSALGGLMAGTALAQTSSKTPAGKTAKKATPKSKPGEKSKTPDKTDEPPSDDGEGQEPPAVEDGAGRRNPKRDKPVEVHLCRGLNSCKGQGGYESKNACAGMGDCATVHHHTCETANKCKGQAGGKTFGRNECAYKGGCEIPLSEPWWTQARQLFERRMKAQGKKFGAPPRPVEEREFEEKSQELQEQRNSEIERRQKELEQKKAEAEAAEESTGRRRGKRNPKLDDEAPVEETDPGTKKKPPVRTPRGTAKDKPAATGKAKPPTKPAEGKSKAKEPADETEPTPERTRRPRAKSTTADE